MVAYGATGSGKTHTVTNLAHRAAVELERQALSGGMVNRWFSFFFVCVFWCFFGVFWCFFGVFLVFFGCFLGVFWVFFFFFFLGGGEGW